MRERLGERRDGAPKSAAAKETAPATRSHPAPERETSAENALPKPVG